VIISVASGKGGTGKTLVATNLALYHNEIHKGMVSFIDCDVEEPNAHIFLKPNIENRVNFGIPVPEIEFEKCDFCGTCAEVCEYNALVVLKDTVLTFSELCHGCGACSMLCPQHAICEIERECGFIEEGTTRGIAFFQGRLNIGEPMASPLITAVKKAWRKSAKNGEITIIDVPPGTSCPVVAAIKGSDFCILVTEPTPFGLHDLKLAVGVLRKLGIPFGIVLNRAGIGDGGVYHYCVDNSFPILVEIPYKRDIAVLYSYGIPLITEGEQYRAIFKKLWEKVHGHMSKERKRGSKQESTVKES
jgi:MinD superfamily P-loop ATPase